MEYCYQNCITHCHNPDVCDLDIWNGFDSWILSGHTHGGQCKAPFLPPPLLPVKNKKYASGEIDLEDGRTLYINRAIGHLWQVRFNVRPEITIFELAKDIWDYLKVRKKYWLAPLIVTIVLMGALIFFTQGSVVAPFIYTIF